MAVVVLTMLPAAYMTMLIIKQSITKNNLRSFVREELTFKGTHILSQNINEHDKMLNIVALGKIISHDTIKKASKKLSKYQLADYKLNIIQGDQSDSLLLMNKGLSTVTMSREANDKKIIEQSQQIHELEKQLETYTRYESLSSEVSGEMKQLFPSVSQISISNIKEFGTDSANHKRYIVVIINSKLRFNSSNRQRLQLWLKERCKADSLRLIITP